MSEKDAQLELKKRARRRLVGAAALAILAAVVLPIVMDGDLKPAAQDILIRIPSQDAGTFGSRILPTKPGAVPTPLSDALAEVPVAVEPPGNESTKPAPAAKAEKPETSLESHTAAIAEDKQPTRMAEEARPQPAKDKDEVAKTKAVTSGEQWVVQIGAYRDAANVRNLQAKLKEQGYNSYTEPLISNGVKKTRVRAGPFPTKEAAEKACDRLKRISVDGLVAQKQ